MKSEVIDEATDLELVSDGETFMVRFPGVNDAWEFLTAKDDSLKLRDVPLDELQALRRAT